MTQLHTSDDIQTLLEQGTQALHAGSRLDAMKYFRQATERDPLSIPAWLGMADAVRSYRDQQTYLQRALAIDPTHAEARERLANVEERLAAGELLAPKLVEERLTTAAPATAPAPSESVPEPAVEPEPLPAAPDVAPAVPAPGPGTTLPTPTDEAVEVGVCYRHPDRETGLRCVQCGRFICTECVRPAFVGQLCPECAKERRPTNYKVSPTNLLVAGAITLGISSVVSWLMQSIGFGFFFILIALFLGPVAGELLLRIIDRATHNKRGRQMQITVGLCYALGAAPFVIPFWLVIGFPPLGLLIFSAVVIGTVVTRLR